MTGPKKKRHVARSPEDLAAKKNLILDAAMRLVIDKGYAKTTISGVAVEAGIGRGTVYWHFDSKDEMFYALMLREVLVVTEGMEALIDPSSPALQTLDGLIRMTFAYYQQAGQLFQAMVSVIGGAGEELRLQLVDLGREMYRKYNGVLAELLERGKAEGDIRPDLDSETTAAAITVLLDAMYLQVGLGLVPNDEDRLTAAITQLIHHGTAPSGGTHA